MPNIVTIQDELRQAHERVRALVDGARAGDRELSAEEQSEVDQLLANMQRLDGKRKRDDGFGALLRSVEALAPVRPENGHALPAVREPYALMPMRPKSLGAQFVEHEVFQHVRAMPKGGSWSSPPFELQAAVTIDTIPAPPAGGYPDWRIQPFLEKPMEWYVSQLFAQGTLSGSLVQYLREKVFTNAAAVVPVGGAKPESTLTFEAVQAALIKIAHWIPVPDEFLEDVEGLRSYIDARMAVGVMDKLEDQVINGSGTGGNMLGILATPGLTASIAAPAGVPRASTINSQRAAIYAASRLRPDAVVMSPTTAALVLGEVSTAGGYLAGPGTMTSGLPSTLWGMRVVESPSIADGTALLGAFAQGGQLWRKGGVTVQATNSHSDLFVKNTTAIRAEIRAALTVYRPAAFGTVTDLIQPGP